MPPTIRLLFFIAIVMCIVVAGCSSSQRVVNDPNGSKTRGELSTETTQKETTSVETAAPIDTTASLPQQAPPSQKKSRDQKPSPSRKQQGFVTQEDTIEAQVVTRNQGASYSKAPPQRAAKKKYYSVQIGAFRILSNADRAQKLAKQRYKKPVYHFYDKAIKMYRVTVGNYSKMKDAFAFRKVLLEQHPKEYKDAWVAEMRR